ncbi:hypothetical protein [Actinosynnema sp.]|uniref:hypothetical protein n=1 Tax=Actinosynnema sp. TaxID=1872144 RepID=UPI003F879AA3
MKRVFDDLALGVRLAVGGGLFLLARRHVEEVEPAGVSVFAEDLTPAPALAVPTSLVATRRTAVEPLGVARQTRAARRKPWWRVLPVVAGVALLAPQAGAFAGRLIGGGAVARVVGGVGARSSCWTASRASSGSSRPSARTSAATRWSSRW